MNGPNGATRQPRRYLLVVHYPIFGGPHNHALRLGPALLARGWETSVLLPSEPGNAARRFSDAGIDVAQIVLHRVRAKRDPRFAIEFVRTLPGEVAHIRRVIREKQVSVVVVGGLVNPHAAFAAWLERVPVIWKIVDSRTPPLLRWVLMPLVHRLADVVMYDGQALVKLHIGTQKPPIPSFVYFPPVDTIRFRPSPERRLRMRAMYGIPAEAPVIGTVANLNPQKGIEFFVRAASDIQVRRPDAWFVVIGARYPMHREYNALLDAELAASSILPGRLLFLGDRPDIENYYPMMDIKVITSVPASEGTTTTAIEAMACGVPVVTTDVGAIREVVEAGKTGLLVQPLDQQAIAQAVMGLLDNAGVRRSMGECGRRRALERYDTEVAAEHLVTILNEAMRSNRARPPVNPTALDSIRARGPAPLSRSEH
jgi:glycosyltransferase involved in cell wall biosynthesis